MIPNRGHRHRHPQALSFNPATRAILHDITVVRRLHTVIETFAMCLQQAYMFKGAPLSDLPPASIVYNLDPLIRPIRQFCAHQVRHTLGVPSAAVALLVCDRLHLCRSAAEAALTGGPIGATLLNRTVGAYAQLEDGWRRAAAAEQLRVAVRTQSAVCQLTQRLLCANMWLHEDLFAAQPGLVVVPLAPVRRSAVLQQLQATVKALAAWRTSIDTMRTESEAFVTAINQRLKWAVGANPQLSGVLHAFTEAVAGRRQRCDRADRLAAEMRDRATAILGFEQLRMACAPEALASDQQFFDLVSVWERSCMMSASCAGAVSAVEEALVELLDPEGAVDAGWLRSVAGIVDEMTDQVRGELEQLERRIGRTEDEVHECAQRLRARMAVHHRLATEVRSLVRGQLKAAGTVGTAAVADAAMREYLRAQKVFVDGVAELHGHVLSRDFTESVVDSVRGQVDDVLAGMDAVYARLYAVDGSKATVAAVIEGATGTTGAAAAASSSSDSPARKPAKGKCRNVLAQCKLLCSLPVPLFVRPQSCTAPNRRRPAAVASSRPPPAPQPPTAVAAAKTPASPP